MGKGQKKFQEMKYIYIFFKYIVKFEKALTLEWVLRMKSKFAAPN